MIAMTVALTRRAPILMFLEDAHWIDPTTLDLTNRVVERVRHLPILLVITFRPEFSPPWTGHGHVTSPASPASKPSG
jgi:predicted ATPase